jgi:hypothetical protein
MTRETFKEYEKICKDAWNELAKSGAIKKPEVLHRFHCACPACTVAHMTQDFYRAQHNELCKFCPITIWRHRARTIEKCDYAMCEIGPNAYYADWTGAKFPEYRKRAAGKIAKLSWSWIPEYKNIDEEAVCF